MNDHRRYREWSAAYVLGALDSDERAEFEVHLAGCEECHEEIVNLAPLPGLMNRVELDEAGAPDRIADLAAGTIRAEWNELSRSRRRWRWTAVAAAAMTVALVFPALRNGGANDGTTIVFEQGTSASGTVLVVDKAWGTAVEIEVRDLPDSDKYLAWAVAEDGRWEQMAAWGPTPGANARVAGASAVASEELEAIVITTGDPTNTVAVANTDA